MLRMIGGSEGLRAAAQRLQREHTERGTGDLIREIATSMPDVLKLLTGLARDKRVPLRYRVALWGAIPYLASPIDLIPDFLPGLGQLDDAALVFVTLRWVLGNVEPQLLDEHWHGSPVLLGLIRDLTGPSPTAKKRRWRP